MNGPMIQLDRISKSFGPKEALHQVSLAIPEGQTFALLGRTGAGKTTLIRILLGLIPADSGTARLAGLDPAKDPIPLRRKIGYLAEDQVMYGWMTPVELCSFLAPFYPDWDMDLALGYLHRFDIPCQTKIRRLSKGQSVKLGLVMALAHRPPVVILDDPAMGLDPIARKEFNRELVEHLQIAGTTILYSSHLLGEVEAVADAVAILDQGRILRAGTTERLREEVKRIVLPPNTTVGLPKPERLLDVREHGNRLSFVVDHAAGCIEQLAVHGIDHYVEDLSLDEIFEAFVIGRKEGWPGRPARAAALSV